MTRQTNVFRTNEKEGVSGFKADSIWGAVEKIESQYNCKVYAVYKAMRGRYWIINTVNAQNEEENYRVYCEEYTVDYDEKKDRKCYGKRLI